MTNSILYNDDCLRAMKKITSNSIDLLLTDPPYNLGHFMKSRETNLKRMRDNFFVDAGWDNLDSPAWEQLMDEFFEQTARVLKKGGAALVFMSIIKVETIIKLATKHGLYYKTTGIWHKLNPMPRNMNLHFINSTEAWVYFTYGKKTSTFNNEGKALHDFIEMPSTSQKERQQGKHPTQKPVALIEYFIKILSNESDMVLDPFMGSGTTGVATKKCKRNFIGIELSEHYFDAASKRIQEVCNE